MRHSLVINALLRLKRSGNKNMALWEKAEPISLDELRVRFAALARSEFASKPVGSEVEELTFEELWRIFESLEDIEDCPIIS